MTKNSIGAISSQLPSMLIFWFLTIGTLWQNGTKSARWIHFPPNMIYSRLLLIEPPWDRPFLALLSGTSYYPAGLLSNETKLALKCGSNKPWDLLTGKLLTQVYCTWNRWTIYSNSSILVNLYDWIIWMNLDSVNMRTLPSFQSIEQIIINFAKSYEMFPNSRSQRKCVPLISPIFFIKVFLNLDDARDNFWQAWICVGEKIIVLVSENLKKELCD